MIQKTTLIFIFKAFVSISLLTFLLVNIDWDTVLINLRNANIFLLVIASSLNIIERFELTFKWNLLIRVRSIIVTFGRLFWINSIGSFLGLFLPSSLGTDVVRGYYLMQNNSEKSVSISSVFVDRVLGLFSLLLLGVVSVFFAGDLITEFNIRSYIIVFFVLTVIIFYLFQKDEAVNYLQKILKRIRHKKLVENVIKLHNSILEYKKYSKIVWLSFFITLLVQVTRVLSYYFIALAFHINVPIIYFFLFVPIIMLVIMVPISIGGLGVREGTFVAFFTLVGMSVNDAVIISFMNSFLDILNTLILGGGGYLFYKSPIKEQTILTNKHSLGKSND
ncbi:flippase-like domain-containing protein [bacterium]|nr:flippase-like domain-containing protein [bacterium]